MDLVCDGINELIPKLYAKILNDGGEVSPRGLKTKELLSFSFQIRNPRDRIFFSKIRNPNYAFMAAEFLWIISNRCDLEMIGFYNKQLKQFSDDGLTFYGAYGDRLLADYDFETIKEQFKISNLNSFIEFGEHASYINQLDEVVRNLKFDKETRKAYVTIFNPTDLSVESKDIPCTLGFQFFIRNNKLNMITNMRSNDAWLGTVYDVFTFTCIQEYILCKLKTKYPDLEIGTYTHNVGSIHLYAPRWGQASEVINDYNETELRGDKFCSEMRPMLKDWLESVKILEDDIRKRSISGHLLNDNFYSRYSQILKLDDFWQLILLMISSRSRKESLKEIAAAHEPFKSRQEIFLG